MRNIEEIGQYILQYQPVGLIIDTQLLLLFFIGNHDKKTILNCNLTRSFTEADFELLKKIIKLFSGRSIIITPHILTEISNMSIRFFNKKSPELYRYFTSVIKFLGSYKEDHHNMHSILGMGVQLISDYGFTDLGVVGIADREDKKIAILTDDTDLYVHAAEKNIPVIKLSHLNPTYATVFVS